MESKGKLFYRNDKRLRWEYLAPYTYTFVLNERKILMQSESSRNVMDVEASRFFRELVRVMMNGIDGNGLTDTKNYRIGYFIGENRWKVEFVPLRNEIKKIFSLIKLTFNVQDYSVDSVEMEEPGGDRTIIRLYDKQFNKPIDDEMFVVD